MRDVELWCPSLDVCAICGDCECSGLACYESLFTDDHCPVDDDAAERIETIQGWVRRGRVAEQAEEFLAGAENRPWPHAGWVTRQRADVRKNTDETGGVS